MPSFTLADGVNLAMRMLPNYRIVGEVRDGFAAEARMRPLQSGHAFERIANLMALQNRYRRGRPASKAAS